MGVTAGVTGRDRASRGSLQTSVKRQSPSRPAPRRHEEAPNTPNSTENRTTQPSSDACWWLKVEVKSKETPKWKSRRLALVRFGKVAGELISSWYRRDIKSTMDAKGQKIEDRKESREI